MGGNDIITVPGELTTGWSTRYTDRTWALQSKGTPCAFSSVKETASQTGVQDVIYKVTKENVLNIHSSKTR